VTNEASIHRQIDGPFANASLPARNPIHAYRLKFGQAEAAVLRDELTQCFAIRQLGRFGDIGDVDAPIYDVDATFSRYRAGDDAVGEEGGRLGRDAVVEPARPFSPKCVNQMDQAKSLLRRA
jgi:hypothetical protein